MFGIEWPPDVEIVLLELWAMAKPSLRAQISAAINELERRLALDPLNEGESRIDGVRVTFERPLGIKFTVDNASRTVRVLDVWLFK